MTDLVVPALVILQSDPLRPQNGQKLFAVSEPVNLRAWLDSQGIDEFIRPTICSFNGRPLLRRDWAATRIEPGCEVRFMALAAGGGGGGGGGGKSPLKIVLTFAVMAVGLVATGPLAGAMGFTQATAFSAFGQSVTWMSIGKALVGGAISMLGNALISAVLPSAQPAAAAQSWGQSSYGSPPAPSPTYSLTAQGNQARLGQPIPEIFGRHVVYPDLLGSPYQEYVDNEQYLFQLHCIGVGEYDVETMKIDDTPFANFSEIQSEIVPPGGTVTLVETNVCTANEVAGQELKAPNELASGEDGWVGPFVASPAETTASALGFDVVCPRGLYYANDSGALDSKTISWVVEIQPIDDDGFTTGNSVQIGSESITDNTNNEIRRSYRYAPTTVGRYYARMRRTDTKDTSSRAGHELRWVALRSYLTQATNFGDVTVLAVKAKATNQLSNRSSRLVNLVVTRKLPVWDPITGWSAGLVPTRSIAWAAAYVGRAANGGQLIDSRLHLDQLATLDATWAGRSDTCDGIFDTTTTVWDAMTRILRAGRAMCVDELGAIRFIRDEAKTLPTMTFTPRDIVKGSVEVAYITPDDTTADTVKLEYFKARTWRPATVLCTLPESDAERPVSVQLPLVTDTNQATREGLFMAADNKYGRIRFTFTTHRGGLIPRYGDPVALIHPLARSGQGGEVLDWDAEAEILTLSEPVTFNAGETHYIALVGRGGMQSQAVEAEAVAVQPDGRVKHLHVLGDLDLAPYTGGEAERTRYCFGPAGKLYRLGIVKGAIPKGNQVQLICVAEDSRRHVN